MTAFLGSPSTGVSVELAASHSHANTQLMRSREKSHGQWRVVSHRHTLYMAKPIATEQV